MKSKQENLEIISKKNVNSKHSLAEFDKLKTNSVLFFQIGLIMVLLATYTLLEMEFKVTSIDLAGKEMLLEESTTILIDDFIIAQPEKPKEIKVIKNDVAIKKKIEADLFRGKEVTPKSKPLNEAKLHVEEPEEEVNIMSVEHVPVFPGCESQKTRDGKLKCMSKKMAKFIQKKFDADLAGDLGLRGKQRIHVFFKIDENGNVTNLKARAPHDKLEDEAKRVVGKLPKMIPGKQGKKPVSVMYSLPILFNVQ